MLIIRPARAAASLAVGNLCSNGSASLSFASAGLGIDDSLSCSNIRLKLISINAANRTAALDCILLSSLVRLIFQRSQQRTNSNTSSAQVGDLIDLQDGIDFARAFQDFLDLIGSNGIQATSEAVQLD